ncbi:MAG: hydrogenase formation protein HypD [Cyclobacteriaceae bacterium]|nr:hydrogenase formation protein HypD [Cyclobacteriaceae bacterium]
MKYLDEYRNGEIVKKIIERLYERVKGNYHIMEICGGQTHSLVKNGIIDLLPPTITMVHGPGCPVCVTPISLIDQAIELAHTPGVVLFSFGDMIRVPGSEKSLLSAQSEGASVKIVYSPLDAVKYARLNPDVEVVFFAVGFETTAPANALSVLQAELLGVGNYSILASHVLVPPAMEAILNDEENKIDGFLAAGHVCTVMGTDEYEPLAKKYNVPIVVTGFEPVDLLKGIEQLVKQLEAKDPSVTNQYRRVVKPEGNVHAKSAISKVFEISDREWRGIGVIPNSGYKIKNKYRWFDASIKFDFKKRATPPPTECRSGEVLKGKLKPIDCPLFEKVCKPENPLGAPMVSSEGACAAYYHFATLKYTSHA